MSWKPAPVENIAANVWKLCTWKFFSHRHPDLFVDAAERAQKFGKPPILAAAEKLRDAVGPDDVVILSAGFIIEGFYPHGESDGPLGVASLARAVCYGLRGRALMVSEPVATEMIGKTSRAAGCRVVDLKDFKNARKAPRATATYGFPVTSRKESRELAKEIIDEYDPKAMVFVEKPGPNVKGVYHTLAAALSMSDTTAKVDCLVEEAEKRGIPTIGCADGGNEIGCGVIEDFIRKVSPLANRCNCPPDSECGGAGYATSTPTDVLIIGPMSNVGAYGISACVAAMAGRPEIYQDVESERLMVYAMIMGDARQGSMAIPLLNMDGVPLKWYLKVSEMIRFTVEGGVLQYPTRIVGTGKRSTVEDPNATRW